MLIRSLATLLTFVVGDRKDVTTILSLFLVGKFRCHFCCPLRLSHILRAGHVGTIAGSGTKYGCERRSLPCQGYMCVRRQWVEHGVSSAATGDCERIPE